MPRLRRAGAAVCTLLAAGALGASCGSLLPEPVRCSCDEINTTSTCRELSGPADDGETYQRLCDELSDACAGTYVQTACPNSARVAVCNRQSESFTESLVFYNVGGDPVQVGDEVSEACAGYGVPEYY